MNCKDIKKLIYQWEEGRLDSNGKGKFEDHLIGCPACQKEAESVRRFQSALRSSAPAIEPSIHFEAEFWARLLERQKEPWYSKLFRAMDDFIPRPNFAQAAVVFSLAVLIGGMGGVLASLEQLMAKPRAAQTASALHLSGPYDSKGIPGSSLTAIYLKIMDERGNAS